MLDDIDSVLAAVQKARGFFAAYIISDLVDLPQTMDVESLTNFLVQEVDENYSGLPVSLHSFPDDYFQLAKVMKGIFSAQFCRDFKAQCLAFDAMVDSKPARRLWLFRPSLKSKLAISSAMIANKTYMEWIEKFCADIATSCVLESEMASGSETGSSAKTA
ncbi:hypothetical protein PWT90_09305 [Aphanocladium album]|nr:hypothetical protein PWT90_09305 [Aphanocladium album]